MKGWVGRPGMARPLRPRIERSPPTGTVREKEPRPLQSETTSASAVKLRQPGVERAARVAGPTPQSRAGSRRAGLAEAVTRAEGWGQSGPRRPQPPAGARAPVCPVSGWTPTLEVRGSGQTLESANHAPSSGAGFKRCFDVNISGDSRLCSCCNSTGNLHHPGRGAAATATKPLLPTSPPRSIPPWLLHWIVS